VNAGSENQFVMDGDWVDDAPHGSGVMLFENGDRYEGRFVTGRAEGPGSKTWAQPPRAGHVFQGDWYADMRHGQGVMAKESIACPMGDGTRASFAVARHMVRGSITSPMGTGTKASI